jgi:putative acetyltransferase
MRCLRDRSSDAGVCRPQIILVSQVPAMSVEIRHAERADIDTLRDLLREYALHLTYTLGVESMCMERFEQELAILPSPYDILLLAFAGEAAAGCVMLKMLPSKNEKACELKRLWVGPRFRGSGIGRQLTESAMRHAAERGYGAMYLDTVPAAMQSAHRIYQELGFEAVERYNDNPVANVRFFRCAL